MSTLIERTFDAEQRHFWYRGFRRFVAPLLEEATAGLPNLKLLDAGCGTGANLLFLQNFGEAFGLELVWRGLQFGRSRGVGRLTQGSVTHLPYRTASVDVVLSFDVLYCLHPPGEQAAIAEMFRVLRPGGAVIINVAAMEMLRGDHSILGGEVHRYTRRDLGGKLKQAGFQIRRLTYTNASLFPIMAPARAFQRLRGLKSADSRGDFYVPPAPINELLGGILRLESRLVKAGLNMPFGSSLLCLARKPGGGQLTVSS